MRLSEAIRLGSTLHPQAFHAWSVIGADEAYSTCAMGAAVTAMGVSPEALYGNPEGAWAALVGFWPALDRRDIIHQPVNCPECHFRRNGRAGVIAASIAVHLNDYHRWTRERIADWLETSGLDPESAGEKEAAAEPVTEVTEAAQPVEEPVCV